MGGATPLRRKHGTNRAQRCQGYINTLHDPEWHGQGCGQGVCVCICGPPRKGQVSANYNQPSCMQFARSAAIGCDGSCFPQLAQNTSFQPKEASKATHAGQAVSGLAREVAPLARVWLTAMTPRQPQEVGLHVSTVSARRGRAASFHRQNGATSPGRVREAHAALLQIDPGRGAVKSRRVVADREWGFPCEKRTLLGCAATRDSRTLKEHYMFRTYKLLLSSTSLPPTLLCCCFFEHPVSHRGSRCFVARAASHVLRCCDVLLSLSSEAFIASLHSHSLGPLGQQ